MTYAYGTPREGRVERLFMSVNVASIVTIILLGVFYLGYLLLHEDVAESIRSAIVRWDFVALQEALEAVTTAILTSDGWVAVTIGLSLLLMSFLFIVNTAGIVFSVFIHRPFSAGGEPTVRWWRLSLSRLYLTLRLLVFIALYKTTGLAGFSIMQNYFPNNPILNMTFFFSSALSLGTLIVLASVVKVVVYEISRYETMVESNRLRVSSALREYMNRWRDSILVLEEARFKDDLGYITAKLEDATRDLKSDFRLLERSRSDLERISSPRGIMKRLFITFVGVVIIQMVADVVLYLGWGNVLNYFLGWLG
ncbi:MAG: hypothetical protein QXS20_10650 [Candidatus Thorarchaeota archaeon]